MGYRKGFSALTTLFSLIEKWKIIIDNKGFGRAVLMDLSKAFDVTNYEILIAACLCKNALNLSSFIAK